MHIQYAIKGTATQPCIYILLFFDGNRVISNTISKHEIDIIFILIYIIDLNLKFPSMQPSSNDLSSSMNIFTIAYHINRTWDGKLTRDDDKLLIYR